MKKDQCKICRRLGVKLFLKGERCFSPKCAMIKRPYAARPKRKRSSRGFSEYGREMREKQKLKAWYNLGERQFRRYVRETLTRGKKTEDFALVLIKILESRLDNVIFRLGIASSRTQARQMVSHRHFLVNGRPVNISSYLVKKGDKIALSAPASKKIGFAGLSASLKKKPAIAWLALNAEKVEAEVIGEPTFEEAAPPADISLIFAFYSK
ncbi:MAG: 30S ribosomal protein S4 [Candidatus Nealsonbacteria bacterium CG08_land_8_20_14_0_20_43_11]|uniref:Small ribosomal subunit protein uS4 n=1 Tax=Candidatus Nealsonbacteria bacterium CG08_land_8_20_14_0_20_43_11 TaxID=1974706 RepID=A0A2M6T0V4_9BACT|nr:MAG: 30S ribosomal protein S4 [Candidatus Nealsonbacteria bacterium CG08_land_8_20_14_0_20_43_11]